MHDFNVTADEANKKLVVKTTYSGLAEFRLLIKEAPCKITKEERINVGSDVEKIGGSTYILFKDNLNSGINVYSLI